MNDSAQGWVGKSRLEALSDGIYAVALTLLVLELKLPPASGASEILLQAVLLGLAVKAGVWLLSFWVGILFWLAQSRALGGYAKLDRAAILIEFAQLALISLLPFSTALMGEHGAQVAAALIYSVHIALLATLALLRAWRLEHNPELRAPGFEPSLAARLTWRAGLLLVCALVASLLALVLPGWNMLAMLGVLLQRPWVRIADVRSS